MPHSLLAAAAVLLVASCGNDDDGSLAPIDRARPADVADLGIIATSPASLTLGWTAPGDDGTAGLASAYDLRHSNSPITAARWDSIAQFDGEPAPRASGQAETLRIEGLAPDTTYYFALRARDDASNASSLSNIVAARTVLAPTGLPPARITDLFAAPATTSSIVLTWTAPGDHGAFGTASLYDVRYSTTSLAGDGWYAGTFFVGEPSPQPTGSLEALEVRFLTEATTYYFGIRTFGAGSWSSVSNVVSATVKPDTTPPARIDNLAATAQSPMSVALRWTAPGDDSLRGNAAQYDVRFSTLPITENDWENASRTDSLLSPGLSGTAESLLVRGLQNDSAYYFAIRAADNASNWSALSNIVSAGPLIDDFPPAAIADLRGGPINGTTVRLEWSASGDDGCEGVAASYDIRYSPTPIDEASWPRAVVVSNSLAPDSCGEPQSLTFDVPNDTALYFVAIRAVDELGHISSISNVLVLDLTPSEGDNYWRTDLSPMQPLGQFTVIYCVEGYAGSVVIAGVFNKIDNVEVNGVAFWDGNRWQPMGSGFWRPTDPTIPPPTVWSATQYQGSIVVGGVLYGQGPFGTWSRSPFLHRWDPPVWTYLGAPFGNARAQVNVVSGWGQYLYYSGDYTVGSFPLDLVSHHYVTRRTGASAETLGEANAGVLAIAEHQGMVIVGGAFTEIDSVPANHVAMWDGSSWSAMNNGLDGNVRAFVSDGARLIAGGDFRTAGGAAANHIAEWDGASWQPLGDGLGEAANEYVRCLAFHDGELFAGGSFSDWESRGIRNIARWNGSEWRGLGSGTNGSVTDILSYNGVLYAVGAFDSAGAKPTSGVAVWDDR
ncbi:MAG: fibronectin type III domain-containing protein [bacterium]